MAAPRTLSFIIPVRDDARRLRRCLDSIARHSSPPDHVQVIVVDNGSRDDSAEVARSAGALVLSAPGRVAALRNRGATEATGDVLAFVDADHEIDVDWARSALRALSDESVAAVGAPCTPPPHATWVQQRYQTFRPPLAHRQAVDWLGSGNLAIRRDVFLASNGFDSSLETCEDVDLCNRLALAGHRIVADPALRSIHSGDPETLRALFHGELWRGRDNLRVTFRGPRSLRHFRSALIAMANLAALAGGVGTLALGLWRATTLCAVVPAGVAAVRVLAMSRRDARRGIACVAQSFIVALTYDLARALALLAGGSHAMRRSSAHRLDVTANSHP